MEKMMDLKVCLERIFYCNICKSTYKNNTDYREHILVHVTKAYVKLKKQKIYACKSCKAGFLNGDDYKLHKIHHIMQNVRQKHIKMNNNRKHYISSINGDIERKYECPDCGRKFVEENTLKVHSQVHEPYPYICFCGIGYYSEFDFTKHKSIVHCETVPTKNIVIKTVKPKKSESKVIYKDDFEEDIFDDKESEKSVKLYDDYDYGKKPRKTKKIIKKRTPKIKLEKKLITHKRQYHKCSSCNKRHITNKEDLENNVCKYKSSKCRYCGKEFKHIYARQLHERIHTGEKPYSCKFCSKPFTDPSALLRHTRTHTKDYKYFCDLCPKKFTDKSGLINHRRRHGAREFKCDICSKLFFTKGNLAKHFEIHIGKKNFECNKCGKKFVLKSYLFIHIVQSCEKKLFMKTREMKKNKHKKKKIKCKDEND
ncbi:zinc finger protein 454-like [Zerene cesonia]|uniref:zinc finger protein 454-like n=1 Tax=Zerene cesonia TaxID=33412 RepID=UPI0018E4FD9A|nr:zinc finger protein 454-like [Zerene cesonia]